MLTTGELAKALGVSRGAINSWHNAGMITPKFTTPGGHHRWDLDQVNDQLAAWRERQQADDDDA